MVRAAALVIAFAASACGSEVDTDMYDRASDYTVRDLEDRVADLEARVDELQSASRQNADAIAGAINRAGENEKRLYANDQTFLKEANQLRVERGQPPIPYQE